MPLTTPPLSVVPSVQDACDRCGASAKLSLVTQFGGKLAFCGHHANKFVAEILRSAKRVLVEDGFYWLGEDPTPQ